MYLFKKILNKVYVTYYKFEIWHTAFKVRAAREAHNSIPEYSHINRTVTDAKRMSKEEWSKLAGKAS